jgi:Tfp pilus assembly protein PilN
MRKFFILFLVLISTTVSSQTATEEAIILNQELQYLEDSVKNIQSVSINTKAPEQRQRALNEKSLENTYFGETEEDVISTRTSSPKRRGL